MNREHVPVGLTTVWDPLVRIAHWTLVASVFLAWLTRHAPGRWHEWLGYTALGIVGVRLLWGFCGSCYARFSTFIRGPRETLRYAGAVLRGSSARHIGHNPLGSWMIVALLFTVSLVCASGWLYTTDAYWGVEWVETLHRTVTNVLIALIVMHVAGVVHATIVHRENLIGAMFHGRKRPE